MKLLYTAKKGQTFGNLAYPGDAGIDIPVAGDHVIKPGEFLDIPSGVAVAIEEGYYGRIAARSGALRNRRLRVYEGVIDAGYRGELFTYAENVGTEDAILTQGDKLAQLILQPVVEHDILQVWELPDSIRGTRGFGSSDKTTESQMVYLGGPIDNQSRVSTNFRQRFINELRTGIQKPVVWYDPLVACAGITDPAEVWDKNNAAIEESDLVLFIFPFPPNYGFGSPLEMVQARRHSKPVLVFHQGKAPGTYLRALIGESSIYTKWPDFALAVADKLGASGG